MIVFAVGSVLTSGLNYGLAGGHLGKLGEERRRMILWRRETGKSGMTPRELLLGCNDQFERELRTPLKLQNRADQSSFGLIGNFQPFYIIHSFITNEGMIND